jgi:hypothetical protein
MVIDRDFGTCSYICPGIQAMFGINATNSPHSLEFREAASGDFAHREALRAGKANALIGLDVIMNDEFARKMKSEFVEAMKNSGRWEVSEATTPNGDGETQKTLGKTAVAKTGTY